jgi:hypothetical protein
MEYWRAVILEALPPRYILPFLIVMTGMYFLPDAMMDATDQGGEIVTETYDSISHNEYIGWEAPVVPPVSQEMHSVGRESSRVQLN